VVTVSFLKKVFLSVSQDNHSLVFVFLIEIIIYDETIMMMIMSSRMFFLYTRLVIKNYMFLSSYLLLQNSYVVGIIYRKSH
jgi:hypothetical protein